jgi:thymidylate kinase
MVKIITFEGVDYSGKTTTIEYMAQNLLKGHQITFNTGPVYPKGLTARLLVDANNTTDQEREFLYTMVFALDTLECATAHISDDRTVIQDRYWPSVISYGRFLNKEKSMHLGRDFRPFFILPATTIYLNCSHEAKIERSKQRERKSQLDQFLLDHQEEFERLEAETERSLVGLPNVLRIDTTHKPVQQVASEVVEYLKGLGLLTA